MEKEAKKIDFKYETSNMKTTMQKNKPDIMEPNTWKLHVYANGL